MAHSNSTYMITYLKSVLSCGDEDQDEEYPRHLYLSYERKTCIVFSKKELSEYYIGKNFRIVDCVIRFATVLREVCQTGIRVDVGRADGELLQQKLYVVDEILLNYKKI